MILDTLGCEQTVSPFLDGELVTATCEGKFEIINPSNGHRLLSVPVGCENDVNRAVASSRRAVDDGRWRSSPVSVRKKVLHRLADLIEAEACTLDVLDAGEMGKPVREERANAAAAAHLMRFYAEVIDKILGDVYTSDQKSFVAQRRVPRGVVAAIVPWNFPTYNAVLKLGPALAGGNSVVLKPSELSSRSAVRLAILAVQAGVPAGVFNVVQGLGSIVGRAQGLHPEVDMVTFTGSASVGKQMLQYAGQSNNKVVMTECGGKSPQIVFDDGVDLDVASESIADLLLTNQGQLCSVGSRLLVQRSLETAVLERVAARMSRAVIGDALDPRTTFGPLVSARQCARVMEYIDTAQADGAELITGGRQVMQETGGYFVEPTVFRNVSPETRIAQDEIFGPVLSMIPFDSETEAIRIANSTKYGLMAYVWTTSLSTGMRVAKGIRSSVMINAAAPIGEGPGHAFSHEPAGESGLGVEGGLAGMEAYLRRQLVWINHA